MNGVVSRHHIRWMVMSSYIPSIGCHADGGGGRRRVVIVNGSGFSQRPITFSSELVPSIKLPLALLAAR